MTRRTVLIAAALAVVIIGAIGFWRSSTAPELPVIDLQGAEPALVEAIEKAKAEVLADGRSSAAWGNLGSVLAANGYSEQAAACFNHAARFEPEIARWPALEALQYLNSGKLNEAIPPLRKAVPLASNRDERGTLLFFLATALINLGDLDGAAESLADLGKLEPESPRLTYTRGILALARGNFPEAKGHFLAVANHPSTRRRVCEYLALYFELDPAQAQAKKEHCAQMPTDQPWPNSYVAEVMRHRVERSDRIQIYHGLIQQGRADEALDYLVQLAAQKPDAEVCHWLGFERLKRKEYRPAAESLQTALAFDSKNPKTHLYLGAALFELGQDSEAIATEDRALTLQANLALAQSIRGRAFKRMGKTNVSLEAFRNAVTCQPESAELHRELGEALAEAGKLAEGIAHLEDAVKLAPPDAPLFRDALAKWKKP